MRQFLDCDGELFGISFPVPLGKKSFMSWLSPLNWGTLCVRWCLLPHPPLRPFLWPFLPQPISHPRPPLSLRLHCWHIDWTVTRNPCNGNPSFMPTKTSQKKIIGKVERAMSGRDVHNIYVIIMGIAGERVYFCTDNWTYTWKLHHNLRFLMQWERSSEDPDP